jgi:hypothetical protein
VGVAQVMVGVAWLTVRVKFCVASAPTPLCAVIVMGNMPAVPAAGVPLRVADPFPLLVNARPVGRAPVSLSVDAGIPDAMNANVAAVPTTNVALLAEKIVGGDASGCAADCPPPPQPERVNPKRPNANRPLRSRPDVLVRRILKRDAARRGATVRVTEIKEKPKNLLNGYRPNVNDLKAPDVPTGGVIPKKPSLNRSNIIT